MALLQQEQLMVTGIEEGDAGLILKKDGSFHLFNTHKDIDQSALTERQVEQGKILLSFSVALQSPQIMELLHSLAAQIVQEHPEVIAHASQH